MEVNDGAVGKEVGDVVPGFQVDGVLDGEGFAGDRAEVAVVAEDQFGLKSSGKELGTMSTDQDGRLDKRNRAMGNEPMRKRFGPLVWTFLLTIISVGTGYFFGLRHGQFQSALEEAKVARATLQREAATSGVFERADLLPYRNEIL